MNMNLMQVILEQIDKCKMVIFNKQIMNVIKIICVNKINNKQKINVNQQKKI